MIVKNSLRLYARKDIHQERAKPMRFFRLLSISVTLFVLAVTVAVQAQVAQGGRAAQPAARRAPPLVIAVKGFADGSVIPSKYTQAGSQTSPAITWAHTPAGTMSFFLHMHDMDASRNHTTQDQVHWLVWNIPGTATGLPEGIPRGPRLRDGAYQISAGGPVYRGPGAPAAGPFHHYAFELYALDTKLDVQPAADAFKTRTNIMEAIQGHILGKAVYIGRFHRPR
jgi:Raf kinase inhibitor-like YbhB/YbcL family protein